MTDIIMRFGRNALDYRGERDGGDFAPALQRALDSGERTLYLPAGTYTVSRPLRIRSNTTLALEEGARVVAGDGALARRGDFLLTNANVESGDENIAILGGTWDGNYRHNPKGGLMSETGYSGALINLVNVRNLTLRGLTLHNSAAYYSRFARLTNFVIEDITLSHDENVSNNDGIHLGGYCENGVIRGVRGASRGTPSDDLIALNADDCVGRVENHDLPRGPIRNLLIDDIYAESCHCFVRMLSVTAEIANIRVRGVRGSADVRLLNLDAARYCRTPLIDPSDPAFARGVGNMRDVVVEGASVAQEGRSALIQVETNAENFAVYGYERPDGKAEGETILMRNISPSRVRLYGLSEDQSRQLLRDSKLAKYEVVLHADGTRGIEAETDYYDTLSLKGGGFGLFSVSRIV